MAQAQKSIRVVLIGGSGYVGYEAIRILARHDKAQLVGVFGQQVGPVDQFHPQLTKQTNLRQEAYDIDAIAKLGADVALLCVPHKVAMSYVPQLRQIGLRVVDWSADYRIRDAAEYEKWYGHAHSDAANLAQAVYGLPEFYADRIAKADLVANPGCYPTSTALALAPVVKAGLIETSGIIVSAISGVSGAGRQPSLQNHYPERNENFEPYGVGKHRHTPEMEQTVSDVSGKSVSLLFQPHLCPMDRGMLCTIYARPANGATEQQILDVLQQTYADKPFVRVRTDVLPATKYVAQTNYCDVAVRVARGQVILFSAVDNLIKGASGQAIQNMNIMFGLDETSGLY